MGRVCLGLTAALLLVSCRQDNPEPVPAETPTPTESASATPLPASGARAVAEETGDFLFEYSYPEEAGDIPELAALLGDRLDEVRADIAAQSAAGREAAHDDGFPFNKYSSSTAWQVVANTPRFLSLSSNIESYTGGAHGNYGFGALVWDREAGKALEPEGFFTSLDALDDILAETFCEQLNAERAKRRRQPVEEGSEEMFDACVPLSDTTILLGSAGGKAFNRIGVQVGPYVAGPYAEGSFEFTFPVTPAMLEVVKEEYRSAFAVR